MQAPASLPAALLILRLSITAFFAVWVVEKFVAPEKTVRIWEAFYFVDSLPKEASYGIGVFQALVLLAFTIGFKRFWSTGLLMVMHGLSTLSTYERLMDPYSSVNHLFWAAVPTLAALIALFMLRDYDTLLTVKDR